MIVIDKTKATTIGIRIDLADTSLKRLIGLMGRRRLDAGCGLLITPSSGIHTFGMRFPIDAIALDKENKVVRLWQVLVPLRVTTISLKIRSVLELPAGRIRECEVDIGDQLEFEST